MVQFTVGTGYEVRQISFPFSRDTKPAGIERATQNGLTGTAIGNQIVKLYSYSAYGPSRQYGYGISTDSL
jgi:hypothetical protein